MKLSFPTKTNLKEQVRILALGLPVGGRSTHLLCPMCAGGRSKERSFVISRADAALFYQCYRNSCGWKGAISSIPTDREVSTRTKMERGPDPYPFSTRALIKEEEEFLINKFELSHESIVLNRVKHNIPRDKYVFPIMNVDGEEIGLLDRDFRPNRQKVSDTWFTWKVPHIYFPRPVNKNLHRRLFIVEDVVSAIKVNQLGRVAVCALLGTSISDKNMQYLATLTDGVTFMLDPDAIRTAHRYKKRYALMFKQPVGVIQLRKDPKDTPMAELAEIIF